MLIKYKQLIISIVKKNFSYYKYNMNYRSYLLIFTFALSLFSNVYSVTPSSFSTEEECELYHRRNCVQRNNSYYTEY